MQSRVVSLVMTLLVLCAAASAQTIGNYVLAPNASPSSTGSPLYTILDLSSPATSAGTIGVVAVRGNQPCTNAFKVKFFHNAGGTYTPYAERGPFDITRSITTVTLTPGVAVAPGDLIGLVALADCSGLLGQYPLIFRNAAQFSGDVTSSVTLNNAISVLPGFALAAFGAPNANAEIRTQIIPAAGAAQGAFGASFKTDVFLSNPRSTTAAGRLVYHPEETSGTTSDASFPFIVDSHAAVVYPNFVGNKIGVQGKGSIDVYTRIGFEPPAVTTRVYDEAGQGTKGFTLDALPEREALQTFESAVLATPTDPARFRMNIGLRTLEGETQVSFDLFNSSGGPRASVTRTYSGNYFQQTDFHSLFDVDQQPGDTIVVTMRRGQAFVYGSVIDNVSNDPSAQIAKTVK
jgi:hypothetical protein